MADPVVEQKVSPQDQAALDRLATAHSPSNPQEVQPKYAGKFTSVPDLESSYKNAESELGKRAARITELERQIAEKGAAAPAKVETPAVTPEVTKPEITPAAPVVDASAAAADAAGAELKAKGLDMVKYEQEFLQSGSIGEASLAELAAAGFDKSRVDTYIAGVKAIADQNANAVYSVVGGKDEYAKIAAWASVNVPAAELDAYNKALGTSSEGRKLAVEGLVARYQKAVGTEANLIAGNTAATVNADVYASFKEASKDIGDPRYKTDAAFRKQIEQKLGRSKL